MKSAAENSEGYTGFVPKPYMLRHLAKVSSGSILYFSFSYIWQQRLPKDNVVLR